MAFVILYDACVLHDSLLRDLLIRLARKRKLNLHARWSEAILDEMVRSILARRPDLSLVGWPGLDSSCATPSPTAS